MGGLLRRLAVTGGIAEGKSTVVASIRSSGLATISADDVVRHLWSDSRILEELQAALNLECVPTRDAVRERIAADPLARLKVNIVFHRRTMEAMFDSGARVFEIPLLIESILHPCFDCVWVVTCGPVEQLRRLTERLGDHQQAHALIAAQLPTRVKVAFADRVIRTNSSRVIVHEDVLTGLREDGFR